MLHPDVYDIEAGIRDNARRKVFMICFIIFLAQVFAVMNMGLTTNYYIIAVYFSAAVILPAVIGLIIYPFYIRSETELRNTAYIIFCDEQIRMEANREKNK